MQMIKIGEYYAKTEELVNCFYSFFILEEILYSVHRRHRLFSYEHWPQKESDNISQIILTSYHSKDPRQKNQEEILCDGNDPRVVSNGKQAYIVSQGSLHSGINHMLTVLPSRKQTQVHFAKGAVAGKNWQPFLENGQLYVVDSIVPFRLNKLDPETGLLTLEKQLGTDFQLATIHDEYPIMRGGTNCINSNGTLHAWGHATCNRYTHIPYIWTYDTQGFTSSFTNLYGFFQKRGYHIVDPTCFFIWDEQHIALGLSCSQRDWFHPQWFLNVLLILKKDIVFNKKAIAIQDDSIRNSTILHAEELDTLLKPIKQHGGKSNDGKKGCLVCGPSREIDTQKKWTIELCYASSNESSELVGDFDILLHYKGTDTIVASRQIFGTENQSIRVKLDFYQPSFFPTALIQTRVFSLEKTYVTSYFFEMNYEK